MKKFILHLLAFISIYLLAVHLLHIFTPSFWHADQHIAKKYKQFYDETNGFNTVVIGSSQIYRHFVPELFDKLLTNTRSFNFGVSATANPESYFLAESILKENPNSLKFMILELTPYINTRLANVGTKKSYYWRDFEYTRYALYNAVYSDEEISQKVVSVFVNILLAFLRAIDPFLKTSEDSVDRTRYSELNSNGYLSLEKEMKGGHLGLSSRHESFLKYPDRLLQRKKQAALYGKFPRTNTAVKIQARKLNDLNKIAKEKGIVLIFLLSPRLWSYDELQGVADSLPVASIINLIDPNAYPAFYKPNYSFDLGHMDEAGALEFTRELANKFEAIRLHATTRSSLAN